MRAKNHGDGRYFVQEVSVKSLPTNKASGTLFVPLDALSPTAGWITHGALGWYCGLSENNANVCIVEIYRIFFTEHGSEPTPNSNCFPAREEPFLLKLAVLTPENFTVFSTNFPHATGPRNFCYNFFLVIQGPERAKYVTWRNNEIPFAQKWQRIFRNPNRGWTVRRL